MPPSQLLDHPTILIIHANRPLARANLNLTLVLWKVELGKEDLGWCIFGSGFGGTELQREYTIF